MADKNNAAPTGDTAVAPATRTAAAGNPPAPAAQPAALEKQRAAPDPAPAKEESGAADDSALSGFAEEQTGDKANDGDDDGMIRSALDDDDAEGGDEDASAAGDDDPELVELYELNFEDADPDGLRTLSVIGKEFGIPAEKAQELADAATKYGASLLRQQQERTRNGYRDFRNGLKAELKERWGADYSANQKEARQGAAILVRKYGFPKDFDKQDQYAHLADDVRFLNVLRDLHRFNSETPHIQGDAKSMGGGDVYDSLTAQLGGE